MNHRLEEKKMLLLSLLRPCWTLKNIMCTSIRKYGWLSNLKHSDIMLVRSQGLLCLAKTRFLFEIDCTSIPVYLRIEFLSCSTFTSHDNQPILWTRHKTFLIWRICVLGCVSRRDSLPAQLTFQPNSRGHVLQNIYQWANLVTIAISFDQIQY